MVNACFGKKGDIISMNNRMYMLFCGLILISLLVESMHSRSISRKELCLFWEAGFTLFFLRL